MTNENYHPPLLPHEELGPEMVRRKEEPYPTKIDSPIDVGIQGNGSKWGIYRGKNSSYDLVLQPTVIEEGCPVDPAKPNGERRQVLLWSDEPAYIAHHASVAVEPIRLEFINRRIAETAYPTESRDSAKYC
jgi:hypothetical protein